MSKFQKKPTLTYENIKLRPFVELDVERMMEIISIPDVIFLTGSASSSEEISNLHWEEEMITKTRNWYLSLAKADNRLDLAIEADGMVVGEVVINEYCEDTGQANFRILMDTKHASKGIGYRASRMFLDYVTEHLPIKTIVLDVYEFNERARHVYEKLGFVFDYREENAFLFDGKSYASDHFYLMNPFWPNE